MDIIEGLLVIVGGILAISGLIVAKKPDAKALIDKMMPFQAGIGVALLAFGLYNLLRSFGTPSIFDIIKFAPLLGIATLAMIVCSVLLGFMFGMPQIAKWIPGEGGAEQRLFDLRGFGPIPQAPDAIDGAVSFRPFRVVQAVESTQEVWVKHSWYCLGVRTCCCEEQAEREYRNQELPHD